MHIAFAASECVPFSKTGGLADVVGALPRALVAAGHQVSVYVPRYRQTKLTDAQTVVRSITVPFDDHYRFCSVVTGGSHSGVRFYFVDYPPYFDRDALYGTSAGDYPDNAERFALFSRAVLEASKILGVPNVFHCHDWQSALIPVLLRTQYAEDPAFRDVGTVFTIHNMGYQGLFPPDTLPLAYPALGPVGDRQDGILWAGELPERRAGVFRFHYHGEPQVQPRNSDGGVWFWTGRRVARPGFDRDRDSERRRLRRVEPADGQVHRGQVFARGLVRQGQVQSRICWRPLGLPIPICGCR